MPTCPTVRIKFDEKGYEAGIIINESDFDPKIHKLFDAEKPAVKLGRPSGKKKK